MASSSGSPKVCFNSSCKQAIEVSGQGWLCRTGDFADLCDRCASVFKEGKFCDTYHLNASGWRCCESCGKQIHCGCIVSFHMFILLDAGGIECLNCAKTEFILTPNPTWQFLHKPPKRVKETSSNNLKIVPGNMFNSFKSQHELQLTSCSRLCPSSSVEKRCSNNNGPGPFIENQAQSAKARGEKRARYQPLPRYWPQFTDQDVQQLSGISNAKITPLFEKVLSASDVGKIGRLVLPKKCAEAYLPPLFEPEGYPLVIQDSKGMDWALQYRFWPNNNSRMYVLEGITPCIQSMQLQAGDTVTFSRLEPEGKLIMGFRKASRVSPFQKGDEIRNTRVSTYEETLSDSKLRNPDGTWLKGDSISIDAKRKKGDKMCSNDKNFKLRVTLEQVQGLLQPPVTNSTTIVITDDVQFEVFLESPIIGSPTDFSKDNLGSLGSMGVEPTPEHHEHKQTENNNRNKGHKTRGQSFEIDPNRENPSSSFLKSWNIDLNTRPEQEEEFTHVSDSMGLMRLVQESSTDRYKPTINGVTDGN